MMARYQNGRVGRFISVDPESRDNPAQFLVDPQQLNLYSYVRNNPINLIDPDGRCVDGVSTIGCVAAWTFLGGIVTGIVTEFYGAVTDNPSVIEVGQHLRQTSEIGGSGLLETNPYTGKKTQEIKVETSGKSNNATDKNATNDPYGLKSPYSNIKDPSTVGEGKNFTASQKEKIYQKNMEKNGGVLKSDLDGQTLVKPGKSQAGVKPPKNEAQIDHIQPKKPALPTAKPGTNSYGNAQVLSRQQNRDKSNK